jgi:hypothetical protein
VPEVCRRWGLECAGGECTDDLGADIFYSAAGNEQGTVYWLSVSFAQGGGRYVDNGTDIIRRRDREASIYSK